MIKALKIILFLSCLGLMHVEAYPQKPSNRIVNAVKDFSRKSQKKECLSMQLLKSATKIKYGFNNGSVYPDYHYQGYIIVTPNKVTIEIHNRSRLCYSNSQHLTSKQYSKFLNNILSLGIKQNPDDPMILYGGGVYDILIQRNNKTLFNGVEDDDIVTTKGRLSDAFVPLLNTDMREVYNDPGSTFDVIMNNNGSLNINLL